MALDNLPGEIITKKRDEVRDSYLRSVKIRNPDADVAPGAQPHLDASAFADQSTIQYSNAKTIGNSVTSKYRTGTNLDDDGERRGVYRRDAAGATGYVEVSASASGGTILAGDELTEPTTGLRYQCMATAHYDDEEHCPVAGVDTGPATNQDPDTVLQWTYPRPGISPNCTVVEQTDGTGLSGGCDEEDDDTYRERIDDVKANQPASGNDSAYQTTILDTPGVRIEEAFTYPACHGPGTIGFTFTVPPASPGADRKPSAAQIALVYAYIVGKMPADDSIFAMSLLDQNRDVSLEIEWADGAIGWANAAPWPDYFALAPVAGSGGIVVDPLGAVTSATQFDLKAANGDYTTCGDPVAGTVLAFYDRPYGVFRRKEVQSVAGGGGAPWTIVCETDAAASDTSYTPIANQRVCPWSDSLDLIVTPTVAFFESLGPGECEATFVDAGRRQKRSPVSPQYWPHTISEARLIRGVHDLDSVLDASLLEGDAATTVGTPGTSAYLLTLRYLTCFAG